MTCEELIAAAQEALGGLERIRSVRTYHAVLRRAHETRATETVTVWRAAGGRIRVERRTKNGAVVARVANGTGGSMADDDRVELLRDARIAPRNFLAHAAEHRLALRSRPAPNGCRIVSHPAELVLYLFDPKSFQCAAILDVSRRRRIELFEYRTVSGIATPFREHHVITGAPGFRDTYTAVSYDEPLSDSLFEPA